MVVTDVDPREDVLVLPLQSTVLESLTASVVDAAQIPGSSGEDKVLSLAAGGKVYAYVQPSTDFLADMDSQGDGDATEQVLNNLFNFGSSIALNDGQAGFTNLVASSVTDQLPDGGFQPQGTGLPAGSSVLLYGAIGGMAIANGPRGETYGSILAGSNFSDALSTNPHLVDPARITDFADTGAYSHGFAGDDLIHGTSQADNLFGNDTLYSFVTTASSEVDDAENLSGGAGDDILYGGGSAGNFDGGDGTDTFAVLYGAGKAVLQLEVDLTTGQAAERTAPSDTSAPVGDGAPFAFSVPNSYTLTGIEHVIGGAANDWLKGSAGSVIEGAGGADYLDATAQDVTVGYASSSAGVSVQLYENGSVTSGGDAEGDVIGYGELIDVAELVGSAQDDTLGAYFSASFITLTGGGGSDIFQILGSDALGACTITDFSQADGDRIDLRPLGITSLAGVVIEQNAIVIAPSPGSTALINITLGNFTGTLSAADFLFASPASRLGVADHAGDGLLGSRRSDVLLGQEGDDVLFGQGGSDFLKGRTGNDLLHGDNGADVLDGGAGRDRLDGGTGNDVLYGGAGDDVLTGGRGADRLFGGLGDDILDGGKGTDRLHGGGGADTFVLRFGETNGDRILDFSRADGDRPSIVADADITVTARGHGIFLLTDGATTERLIVKGAVASDFAV